MLQYLDLYKPSLMESQIVDMYRKHQIRSPQDIDLEMWAMDRYIWIHYENISTTHYETGQGMYTIIVDNRMPWEQQKIELAHELGHVLLHAGDQRALPSMMVEKQEWDANRFAFYALCPTFMIANVITNAYSREQLVDQLAYHFDVPLYFMDYRLQMLEDQLKSLVAHKQLNDILQAQRALYDYSFRHPANPRLEYLVKDNRVVHRRWRADI